MKRVRPTALIVVIIASSACYHLACIPGDASTFVVDYDDYESAAIIRNDRFILADYQRAAELFIEKSLFDDDIDKDGISTVANYRNYVGRIGCNDPESFLDLVQNEYHYVSDWDQYGTFDWSAYPIETIVNQKGDCEDLSILFVSIMTRSGYDCGIAVFTDHAVAMLCIELSVQDTIDGYSALSVERNGKIYHAFETTGDCPPGYTFEKYRESDLMAFATVDGFVGATNVAYS